jgi:cobalamin biosynthesis Mg chelatase CobN
MTELSMEFMRDDPRNLRTRLAEFVATRTTTKQLARLLDSDVRTAENIRRGHWPRDTHFAAIVRAFGQDVIDAVFTPEIDAVQARLEAEERHARQVYLAAKARRQAVLRAPEGDEHPTLPFDDLDHSVAPVEPRSFEPRGRR